MVYLTRRKAANAIISGVVMVVGGMAALYIGYIIAGNLDAQFNTLATQQNLNETYKQGIANVRNIVIGVFGLIGVTLFIVGASLVIKGLGLMGT